MSDTGSNAAVAATATASVSDTDKAVAELKERFNKKEKVVALATDDQDVFAEFVSTFADGSYKDWTVDVDTKTFTGLAIVQSDNKSIRLIPLASREAFAADTAAFNAAYKWYINRVVNAAMEDDAQQSQFVIVAGTLKQKFELDAFNFQSKVLTKFLREQGLSGITKASLRMSFASAAFAKTQFPRVDATAWDAIIGIAEKQAAKNNYDTSIFDHWKATREVQSADTTTLKLDFAKLQVEEDEADDHDEKPAASATGAATTPATTAT